MFRKQAKIELRKLSYTNDNVKIFFNCSSQFLKSGPYSSLHVCLETRFWRRNDKFLNYCGVTADIIMHFVIYR